MALKETLYLASDNVLEVRNLRNTITDALLATATVTCRVLDTLSGNPVAGAADPITLSAVSGKAGLYRATIPSATSFTLNQDITLEVTCDSGAGLKRVFKQFCVVKNTL